MDIYKCLLMFIQTVLCATINTTQDDFKCVLPDVTTVDTDLDITRFRADFSKISEVKFPGLIGPLNERLICKIKCIDGNWVGPLCSTSTDGRFQPILRECTYRNEHPNLLIAFKNSTIEKETNFPHGSGINARCKQFGLYKLKGEALLRCENGEWSPKMPECVPTTMVTNFTGDAPPTITYSVVSGSTSVEPSGELYIYPESIVHLNCITRRSTGDPEWTWTQTHGQHTAAWSDDPVEKDTNYRLVLNKMAVRQDDIYTCTTSEGQTNTVVVKIANVVCPRVNATTDQLTYFEEGVRLGQSVHFSCRPGFHLDGNAILTCMGSGRWSSEPPRCVQTFCATLKFLGPHVSLVEYNSSYGGRTVFQCSWGYRLLGEPGIECEQDGKWSGEPPTCMPIYCPSPFIPEHGRLVTEPTARDGKYPVGDLVIYACEEKFDLLGESSIVCTENGFWSHPPPFCVLASEKSKTDTIYLENTTLIHVNE